MKRNIKKVAKEYLENARSLVINSQSCQELEALALVGMANAQLASSNKKAVIELSQAIALLEKAVYLYLEDDLA